MKKLNMNTTTYEINNEFNIDIVQTNDEYNTIEGYIYRKDSSVKTMIFGLSANDYSLDDILFIFQTEAPTYFEQYDNDIETLDKAFRDEFFR